MALISIYARELNADTSVGVLDAINDSQLSTLQSLMPAGAAWPTDNGLTLTEFLRALSYEFSRIKRRVADFINELLPETCYEMLPDYERNYGLPDKCAQPTTIAGRRLALLAKMVGFSDQNIPDIVALSAKLGYSVIVDAPVRRANIFTCGSNCNASMFGRQWMYWWRTYAQSGATDQQIECVYESFTQRHTVRSSYFAAWAPQAIASETWTSICWSPELKLFCAVSSSGTGQVATSPDGKTWTAHTGGLYTWKSVCWSSKLKLFCAVGTSAIRVMTSPDGVTWTTQAAPAGSWVSVCWSPQLALFCAVSNNISPQVMVSSDGATWTTHAASDTCFWTSVCWADSIGKFVAVATASGSTGTHYVMTSTDGVTWSNQTAAEASGWNSVTWFERGQLLVAVTGNPATSTHYIMTSPDGVTWTSQIAPTGNWVAIAEPGSSFLYDDLNLPLVAVSNDTSNPQIMISTDAINWTAVATPNTYSFTSCVWAPNLAVGMPGLVAVALSASSRQAITYLATNLGA